MAQCVTPEWQILDEAKLQRARRPWSELTGVFFFTALAFLVMGYHPGLEDDEIYLSGVKAAVHPALFPHNANFFRLQLQATLFDECMAGFVRWTHVPVAWAELFWQIASVFLILWAVKQMAGWLFDDAAARWAGVGLVAAMLTLPASGTALYLMDQHLHPRNLATALILLAVVQILKERPWLAIVLLVTAFALHPLMAAMGISFCIFLSAALRDSVYERVCGWRGEAAAFMPLGWVFEPANADWRKALATKRYYSVYRWSWYEWVGALAPLALFWILWRVAEGRGERRLARFALAVFAYGVLQQALAMVLLAPFTPARMIPLQPMRYLHLVYFFLVLMAGSLLGKYALRRNAWRWAVFLVVANGSMFAWQRASFQNSQHLELPGRAPSNLWTQAFAWIRTNTPEDAYFALDPHYMEARGEDYHGFRALAERDHLADAVKDAAVVTQVPELGASWATQLTAQDGWTRFQIGDFERLKAQFGVGWVLVDFPAVPGLNCRWHNAQLAVCQIP